MQLLTARRGPNSGIEAGIWEIKTPGAGGTDLNEGVGEHVRTRFHFEREGPRALEPVKLRNWNPHRTKKTCFFCRTGFRKSEPLRNYDPAV
jgi:hypothetical protein